VILILFTILLLFAVSAAFFGLASNHGRGPLLYVIIGIIVFIGSSLLFDVLIIFIFNIELTFTIFASYPVGLLGSWLLFSRLKKSWSKEMPIRNTGALDDGVTGEEQQ